MFTQILPDKYSIMKYVQILYLDLPKCMCMIQRATEFTGKPRDEYNAREVPMATYQCHWGHCKSRCLFPKNKTRGTDSHFEENNESGSS